MLADDVLLREELAGLLGRSDFEVVGKAGTPSELIELIREVRPDLAIVDTRMPPTHTAEGLDAAAAIREEFPEKYVRSILMKLRLPTTEDDQRRALAVITYLDAR